MMGNHRGIAPTCVNEHEGMNWATASRALRKFGQAHGAGIENTNKVYRYAGMQVCRIHEYRCTGRQEYILGNHRGGGGQI